MYDNPKWTHEKLQIKETSLCSVYGYYPDKSPLEYFTSFMNPCVFTGVARAHMCVCVCVCVCMCAYGSML